MWRGTPGTILEKGWLPNITGHFYAFNNGADGGFYLDGNPLTCQVYSNASQQRKIGFSAENSCNIFSSSNTGNWVLPRSISVYMCIKYI